MKGGVEAWETADQQALPLGARRKAWKPIPNLGPGLFVDPRARKSRRDACRAVAATIEEANLDRTAARELWRDLLWTTRVYWANKKYDDQPSFGEIKSEIRVFKRELMKAIKALDQLSPAARHQLNITKYLAMQNRHVENSLDSLKKLVSVCDHFMRPKYVKVEDIAIPNCCEALVSKWEKLTGKRFASTDDNESTGNGVVFTSPGPRFIQDVMRAIDPEVCIEQVHSWLKKPRKRKVGKNRAIT